MKRVDGLEIKENYNSSLETKTQNYYLQQRTNDTFHENKMFYTIGD